MSVVDPRDVPGATAFAEDQEAYAWDCYLEDVAATVERTLAAAEQFFTQITGTDRPMKETNP